MRVLVEMEEGSTSGDYKTYSSETGHGGSYAEVPCVTGRCGRCGHEVESFGDGEESVLRTLAVMREECPLGERNFYVNADDNRNPRADAKVEWLLEGSKNRKIWLNDWETGFLNDALYGAYTPKMLAKVEEIYARKGGI